MAFITRLFLKIRYIVNRKLIILLLTCALIVASFTIVHNTSVRGRTTRNTFGISQEDVDYFAERIEVQFRVVQNNRKVKSDYLPDVKVFESEIVLINRGSKVFPNEGWSIFFTQVLGVEPAVFPAESIVKKPDQGVQFRHWNGELYSLEPTSGFKKMHQNEVKVIRYYSMCCSVVFTDVFPNWYIVFHDLEPKVIKSTAVEPDMFVASHNSSDTWKRIPHISEHNYDHYNPPNASDRFATDGVKDLGLAPIPVIPTPVKVTVYNPLSTLNVLSDNWVIMHPPVFRTAATVLQEKWKLVVTDSLPDSNYIVFNQMEVVVESNGRVLSNNETYELSVNPAAKYITIKASHAAGAFYAVQSLLSLTDDKGNIPETAITDGPRYKYRGLMIDVARNFHRKETIKRYIDVMAMYKLNKLHLHLSDDEGWRLEIPGLPELTELGSKRCHSLHETVCLLPFLGSGPDPVAPGSGFYTVEDYKDILHHAVANHVEVIPEIDMPGHSHAAIKSMLARFTKYAADNSQEATRFLLSDLQDESHYASVQHFKDGAVNPCIRSTYTFIEKVLTTLKDIHRDISPLKTFHVGGDEVPHSAWVASPLCNKFHSNRNKKDLKHVFAESVSKISARHNLNLAAWEDGFMSGDNPMPRTDFFINNIYIYIWNNIRALQQAKRAYTFANRGYKVVLTPATNAYFDHPYEPDPKERGLVWATRFINTKKVFQIAPENIYISEGTHMDGQSIPECDSDTSECPLLQDKNNIEGIQASLFGELLRAEWIIDFMLLPRLLALAERAWHAALWEYEPNKIKRIVQMNEDWISFANTLGHRELARLDTSGYLYRIPPPGAVIQDNVLKVSVEFPGLEVQMSTDGGNKWTQIHSDGVIIQNGAKILLRTKAAASDRYSRVIHLE